jgi:hypothetical protein
MGRKDKQHADGHKKGYVTIVEKSEKTYGLGNEGRIVMKLMFFSNKKEYSI